MGRVCKTCGEYKEASCFTPFKGGKNGLYPTCKVCRVPVSKAHYSKERPEYKLFYRAKRRAKNKGLEFTISEKDIKIPDICPVLQSRMEIPSLDRKDSTKGYTPDNIRVISNRANMLKNNATIREIELILQDLRSLQDG